MGTISNVKVEGIPLRDVLTKAGYDPEEISFLKILDPDQSAINWGGYPFPYIDDIDHPDLLVYKVNDELLSWGNRFPVVNWMPTTSYAGADVKQVTNIYIDPEERELSPHDPTIGVFYLKDGQTTAVGQTLSIELSPVWSPCEGKRDVGDAPAMTPCCQSGTHEEGERKR